MTRRRRPTAASKHRALLNAHRKYYPLLLEYQGGGCAICGKPPPDNRRHALDHDHKEMVLRGVLCTACNMRLSDRITPTWLRLAADYLDNPPFDQLRSIHGI